MTTRPFSLLMSVYAGEDASHLDAALNSVSRNTVRPTEIILVQDGPLGDALSEVIARHSDMLNIKTVALATNQGLGGALAAGLAYCTCAWVARFDSDDICLPDRFERQLQYIDEHPTVDVFSSSVIEFQNTINDANLLIRPVETEHASIVKRAKWQNPFNHMAVMFRKKAVLAAGGYQQDNLYEDYCLWVRMILNGVTTGNLNDATVYARAGRSMYERRGGLSYIKSEFRAQRHFWNWGFLTFPEFARNLILRMPVRLLSSQTRSAIYSKWLRTPTGRAH